MKTEPANTMRVICGTDFSMPAEQAANAAAALAARLEETLLLVHSVESAGLGASSPKVFDALFAHVGEQLQAEAVRLRTLGPTVNTELLSGPPDEALVKLARPSTTRLIVVSSLGRRAPMRWLLGSVSEHTAERAAVPTLVVRAATPFVAWARGERALKVFVAMDFTASADAALRWVKEFGSIAPCEVVVGYVDWPPEQGTRLGGTGPQPLVGNPPEVQAILERDLKARVARLLGETPFRLRVEANWGRADTALIELARQEKADLLVTGTHQHHGLERLAGPSVSRGLLHHAPMSVACVPTPAAAPMAGPRIRECKRVLVAVDLNEPHGFAAPHGYSIVQPGGIVRLVHNLVPFRLPNPMIGGYYQDYPSKKKHVQLVAEAEAKLRALAPQEAEARGIVTEVEVTQSRETAQAICAAAERFGADIACIGSHTRPGFTAKVLGSVSLAVLQTSRRPVLVVWPPAE